jgi:Mn-dependent DtxR family transcriptional regulator
VQILEYMKRLPQATAPMLASELGMTAPTVTSALNHMGERGIIEEMSGKNVIEAMYSASIWL